MNICYLADDFTDVLKGRHNGFLPPSCIKSPEGLMTGKQIQEWVANLKTENKIFATTSLFLVRELYLQDIDVLYIYYPEEGGMIRTKDVDNLPLEILKRELEQSDRYFDFEFKKEPSSPTGYGSKDYQDIHVPYFDGDYEYIAKCVKSDGDYVYEDEIVFILADPSGECNHHMELKAYISGKLEIMCSDEKVVTNTLLGIIDGTVSPEFDKRV